MKQSLPSILLLSAVSLTVLIVFLAPKSTASAIDMDLLDPEAVAALQAEDNSATREQVLEKLVSVLRSLSRTGAGNEYDYNSNLGLSKRQIRYHQCYFNPISCFRRRK